MKITRMLPLLEELEGSISDLYKKYASMFKDDREASAQFATMSEEELVHKEIIGHIRLVLRTDPNSFPDVDTDLDLVLDALLKIKRAIGSEIPVSVAEAVKFALMIEVMSTEWYNISAVSEFDPKYATFLRIFLESQGHLKKLVDFADGRGLLYDVSVDNVKAQLSARP